MPPSIIVECTIDFSAGFLTILSFKARNYDIVVLLCILWGICFKNGPLVFLLFIYENDAEVSCSGVAFISAKVGDTSLYFSLGCYILLDLLALSYFYLNLIFKL
jgi:hypothetical protein